MRAVPALLLWQDQLLWAHWYAALAPASWRPALHCVEVASPLVGGSRSWHSWQWGPEDPRASAPLLVGGAKSWGN